MGELKLPAGAPKVIALYGLKGTGKSEVAKFLTSQYGYKTVKLAYPLKLMLKVLYGYAGVDFDSAQKYLEGEWKERVVPQFGVTGRSMMQTLGTEWGRDCINQDMWLNMAVSKIKALNNIGIPIVVDDLRFKNEMLRLISDCGAKTVKIVRDGVIKSDAHISEGGLDTHHFEVTINNSSSLEDLRNAIINEVVS